MSTNLVRLELKLFLREPAALIFGLALSPVILVILGSVPSFRRPDPPLGGLRVVDVYVPIIIAMALAMIAVSALPVQLVTYRERGILRRMSTTPASPAAMLTAQLVANLAMVVVSVGIVLGIGRLAFDVSLPRNATGFLAAFVLSAVALFAIGLLIAAVVRSSKVAQGIGTLLFFPLLFLAGLWAPREVMPEALRRVSDLTPLGAGVQAMQDSAAGHGPTPLHLGVLAAYAVGVGLAAAALFRWE
jgi:ABC-2 type transport system permease protein